MHDVKSIWAAAIQAAKALAVAGVEYGTIQMGSTWTEAEVRELISLSGGEWNENAWAASGSCPYSAPYVIYSASVRVAGITIGAQGSRLATVEDVKDGLLVGFNSRSIPPDEARAALADAGEVGRAATPGEVRAALAASPPESPDNCAAKPVCTCEDEHQCQGCPGWRAASAALANAGEVAS